MSTFNIDEILNRTFNPGREVTPAGSEEPQAPTDIKSLLDQVFTIRKDEPQVPSTSRSVGPSGFGGGEIGPFGRSDKDIAAEPSDIVAGVKRGLAQSRQTQAVITGDIEDIAQSERDLANIEISQQQQEFQRQFAESEGFGESLVTIVTNPIDFTTGVIVPSLTSLGATGIKAIPASAGAGAVVGAGAGSVLPGPGTVAGAITGATIGTKIGFGLTSGLLEYSAEVVELLRENGVDTQDAESLKQAFADEELISSIKKIATAKGLTIGAIDAFSAGVAGRFTRAFPKTGVGKLARGVTEAGIQGGLGGAGEAAGQFNASLTAGQSVGEAFSNIEAREVVAEILAEPVTSIPEIAFGIATQKGTPDATVQEEAQAQTTAVPETVEQPVTQEPADAVQEQEAVQPDEDVRQQQGPEVGEGQLPAEVGGEGVREGGQAQEEITQPRQLEPQVPPVEPVPTPLENESEIKSARPYTRDGGFVDIGPVLNATNPVKVVGKTFAGASREAAGKVADFAVVDIIDRVKRVDTPGSIEAAALGRQAVDDSKAAFGRIQKTTDIALRETGKPTFRSQKAVFELQEAPQIEGTNYGTAIIVDAVEGRVDVSGETEKIVGAIRDLTFETGVLLEEVGLRQTNPATGQKRNFRKTPGGKVFLRIPTPDMFGALMEGQGLIFDAMVQAFAQANGMTTRKVAEVFGKTRTEAVSQGRISAFKRINEEFARAWPKIPTHLYVGGDVVRLFETNPYLYSKRLAESTAARVGFIKNFGQSFQEGSRFNELEAQIREEAGSVDEFIDMTRALNNVPVEKPFVEAGSDLAKMGRGVRALRGVIEAALLSVSALPNISEPAGNIQAFSGSGDLMRSITQLIKHPRATIDTLEQLGVVTKDVADLTIDPDRPAQSIGRIARETGGRVFLSRFINEFQEKLAGTVGLNKVERMRAGKGSAGDAFDLRSMGYSRPDAKRISEGGGTATEYAAIIRRTPAWLVGSPLAKSEKSRAENSRIVRASFAFLTYAQTKIRQFFGVSKAYVEDMNQAIRDRDFGAMKAPSVKMARYIGGTTASGVGAYMITSFAFGGFAGLRIAWEEAKDKPVRFLRDSFIYAMFAGPWGAILRTMQDSSRLADNIVDMTFPGFVLTELFDRIAGRKRYRDLGWVEGWVEVGKRFLPVHKVAKTMMAGIGFGEKQQEMDVAIRGYWKWRFDEAKPTTSEPGQSDEAQSVFRSNMKRAYNAIRAFEDPEVVLAHMVEAIESTGKDISSIKASIRSRKLLRPLTGEQIQGLRDRVGNDAFRVIISHDLLLEQWADSL